MIFVDCCLQTSLESLTDSALMKPPAPASILSYLELTFNKINLAQTNQLHLTIRQFPLAAIFSDFLECPYETLISTLLRFLLNSYSLSLAIFSSASFSLSGSLALCTGLVSSQRAHFSLEYQTSQSQKKLTGGRDMEWRLKCHFSVLEQPLSICSMTNF